MLAFVVIVFFVLSQSRTCKSNLSKLYAYELHCGRACQYSTLVYTCVLYFTCSLVGVVLNAYRANN